MSLIETKSKRPIITTKRLILQPFSPEDTEEFYWVINDPDIIRYVTHSGLNYSKVEEMVNFYSKSDFKKNFYLEIFEKDQGKIIGAILATALRRSRSLEVSYMIEKDFRRRGYAKEAILGFIKYLNNTEFLFLNFKIKDDNLPSRELVNSLGAKMCSRYSNAHKWLLKIR